MPPWERYAQQPASNGDTVIAPPDPYRQAAETRAQQSQQIQASNANRDERRFQYQQQQDADQRRRQSEEDARAAQRYSNAQADAESSLTRIIGQIDAIRADATDGWNGFGETGMSGWLQSGIPGSPAYDLRQAIQTIDANNAFTALQKMRDASPTGGALGQVTERELDLLKSSVANLNPDQSQEQFLSSLESAKRYYSEMLQRVRAQNGGQSPQRQGGSDLSQRAQNYLRQARGN